MASYLLLRDNKETGPYSLNELLDNGLKAYDLVWIQGKSAAWRYPSEVEELKAFASVSEEQPFDRFFKKNTDEKKPVQPLEKNESVAFRKAVFVTMPSQKNEMAETNTAVSVQSDNTYQRIKTITVTENPVAAEIKYEQPLDEIKEMYVKTLQERKQKIARKNIFIKNLKRASVFIYVLALGVLIGFTLKSKSSKKIIADNSVQPEVSTTATIQTPISNSSTEIATQQEPINSKTEQQEAPKLLDKKENNFLTSHVVSKKDATLKKENTVNTSAKKIISEDQNSPGADLNTTTGERTKTTRNNGVEANQKSSDDISKLVSVKSNEYKRGVFGGIRDLQLTVTNDSKYILDNVIVALQYLKPSEQPLKTENISFQSISPNGSLTIAIPPSNRGIKVAFKIVKIESKQLNNQTAGL